MPHANTARQLLVLDPRVADWRVLAAHARPGVAVLRLDPRTCGMAQIAAALAEIGPVAALHLVDHASPGRLRLGALVLTSETLDPAAPCLGRLGSALAPGARVVIWGCDLAATPAGKAFVLRLARALGREVAAATGPVGEAALGGTWTLGFGSGSPAGHPAEAVAPVGLASFRGTLTAPVLTFVPPTFGSYGAGQVLTFRLNSSSPIAIEPGIFPVTLGLVIGATARSAALDVDASTATSLVFRYTVQAGETDANGITVGALSDPGGRLSDINGDPVAFVAGGLGQLTQVLVDTTAPTAVLTPPVDATYGLGSILTFTLATNEAVTVAAGADPVTLGITVGAASRLALFDAAASTANSLVFRYSVRAGDDDIDGVAVGSVSDPGGRIRDAAGNPLSFGPGGTLAQVLVDAARPLAKLDPPADGSYRAGDTLSFALNINEDVAIAAGPHPISLGLNIGGQARSAALDAGASTANRLVFTYTIQAGETDADGIAVGALSDPGGRVADLAGNPLAFNARQSGQLFGVLVDTTAPSATLEGPSGGRYAAGTTLSFALVTSEPVSVAAGMDPVELAIIVGGQARIAAFEPAISTATRLVFTYTVQAGETDTDGVEVGSLTDPGGRVRDLAGNALSFAGGTTLPSVLVDTTAPSAMLAASANGSVGAGQVLTLTLTTNEDVAVAAGAQPVTLVLDIGGTAREAILDAAASTATQLVFRYTVQPGEADGDGIKVGELSDPGGRVTDLAGNALAFDAGGQAFAGVLVDGIAPHLTSLQLPPDGVRKIGDIIHIGLNSSEALSVAAGADPVSLAVTIGGQTRMAHYDGLINSDTRLIFRLDTQEGDEDADGIEIGAMFDPGGRVRDAAGNPFTYAGGQTAAGITVDAVRPLATLLPPADGRYKAGDDLAFTLETSEEVVVAGAGQPVTLALTVGGAARSATLDAGSSTATSLVFRYTVQAGEEDANGITVGGLNDPSGRVADAAGNTLSFVGGTNLAGVLVDGVTPQATLLGPVPGNYRAGGELSFTLVVNEPIAVAAGAQPVTLELNIGGVMRSATLDAAASTATSLVFRYAIQPGDNDADGIAVGALSDPDGRVRDLAGNALTYGGTPLPAVRVDTTAPSAMLDAPGAALYRLGQTLTITLDLDEAAMVSAGADPVHLALDVGGVARMASLDLGASTATRLVFTYVVQPSDLDADGIMVGPLLDPGARITDLSGNALSFSGGQALGSVLVDGIRPEATAFLPPAGLSRIGDTLTFALATSEPVTVAAGVQPVALGLDIGGVARSASFDAGASTAQQLVFRYTVEAGDLDADGITLGGLSDPGGRVTDVAGNALLFPGGEAAPLVRVDGVAPTGTLAGPVARAYLMGEELVFTLAVSEPVTIQAGVQPVTLGFVAGSQPRSATLDVAASTASSLVFRATVQAGDLDLDGISVGAVADAGGRLRDAAGNGFVFAGGQTLVGVNIDTIAPTATLMAPPAGLYGAGQALTFNLATSEAVAAAPGVHPITLGVTVGDQGRTAVFDAGASTPTNLVFRYTIQAGDLDGDGVTVGALSDPGARLADLAGNAFAFNARQSGHLATVLVDGVAPVASLIPPGSATLVAGQAVQLALDLSEAVTVAAGAQPVTLGLVIGGAARSASFDGLANGGTRLLFSYTVQPGDLDADGIVVGPLGDPGGRVRDAAGNTLSFAGSTHLPGLLVDAVPPEASVLAPEPGAYATGAALTFVLATSEPVTIGVGAQPVTLGLTIAGQARAATLDVGASTATSLVFRYTVQAGDEDTDGITVGVLSDPGSRVRDLAGNNLSLADGMLVPGLELNRPAAPVITSIAPDTGASSSDGFTRAETVTAFGTARPLASVELRVDGVALPVVQAGADGVWSASFAAAEGARSLSARELGAEFEGFLSAPFGFVVDRTAPAAPVVLAVGGDATAPFETEAKTPIISGSFVAGETASLTATLNGIAVPVNISGSAWSVTPSAPLALGAYSLALRATDLAGNESVTTRAFSVVDITPPSVVMAGATAGTRRGGEPVTITLTTSEAVHILADVAPVTLQLLVGNAIRTASLDAEASTSTSLVFTALVQAGDLDVDGILVGALSDSDGRVRDLAGNGLTFAGEQALPLVMVDAVPPSATLIAPASGSYTAGDTLSFSLATSEPVVVAPGALPVGLGLVIAGQARTATYDAVASTATTLVFRYTLLAADRDTNGITVGALSDPGGRVADAAGNSLSFDGGVSVGGLALNRPTAPAIVGIIPDTGALSSDGLTNADQVVVSGTAAPGATVEVLVGDIARPTVQADGAGLWSALLPREAIPVDGTYALRAREVGAEFTGSLSPSFALIVDRTTPPAPILTEVGGDGESPFATEDATPLLSGSFDSGQTVALSAELDGAPLAVTTLGSRWVVEVGTALPLGAHSLVLRAVDAAGNETISTRVFSVVDVTPPAVTSVTASARPVSGLGDMVAINVGTSEAVTVAPGLDPVGLALSIDGALRIAALDAEASTAQSLVFRYAVQPGDLDADGVTVTGFADPGGRLRDAGGNAPAWTGPIDVPAVRMDGVAPPVPQVARLEAKDGLFTLSGTAELGAAVELIAGDDVLAIATAALDGAWSADIPYAAVSGPGFSVAARARDEAGNAGAASVPVTLGLPTLGGLAPRPFFGLPGMLPSETGLRIDNPAGPADIPLAGGVISVPGGVTLVSLRREAESAESGLSGPAARIASLLGGLELAGADESALLAALAGGAAASLPADAGAQLIRLSGAAEGSLAFSDIGDALLLDFRGVPGATATLNGTGFAILAGAVTLTGGAGNNIVLGDGSAQILRLGPGEDTLFGGGGNDLIVSDGGADLLDGGSGDDMMFGGVGADLLLGGAGDDLLSGSALDRGEWSVRLAGDGRLFAVFTPPEGLGTPVEYGLDQLVPGVPVSAFAAIAPARLLAVTALYDAMGRVPDLEGLIAWSGSTLSLRDIADAFLSSAEGQAIFGGLGNGAFVARLYQRILDRAPDPDGLEAWTGALASGSTTRAQALLDFTLSAERDGIEQGSVEIAWFQNEGDGWIAGSGNDRLEGGGGDDRLVCGDGIDTAVFAGLRGGYSIRRDGTEWIVEDLTPGRDGTDRLLGMERLEFADQILHIDLASDAAFQVAGLYEALFDRAPDLGGLRWWMDAVGGGVTLQDIAGAFLLSEEAAPLRAMSDAAFVSHLYQALFEREADAGGLTFWTDALGTGFSRADLAAAFLDSEEFLAAERDEMAASLSALTAVW